MLHFSQFISTLFQLQRNAKEARYGLFARSLMVIIGFAMCHCKRYCSAVTDSEIAQCYNTPGEDDDGR